MSCWLLVRLGVPRRPIAGLLRALVRGIFWLFRKFCGSEPTTLMKDTVAKVLNVAEAEGPPLDQLDLGVRAFDETVGDPLVNVGEDLLLPATDALHTLQ
jgi:hypothetical protein